MRATKDLESEWLASDNPEINAITIKPETSSHVAEKFSWVPYPAALCPKKSLTLSAGVSLGSSFLSVRQEPNVRPWKGSAFPATNLPVVLEAIKVVFHFSFFFRMTRETLRLQQLLCSVSWISWNSIFPGISYSRESFPNAAKSFKHPTAHSAPQPQILFMLYLCHLYPVSWRAKKEERTPRHCVTEHETLLSQRWWNLKSQMAQIWPKTSSQHLWACCLSG